MELDAQTDKAFRIAGTDQLLTCGATIKHQKIIDSHNSSSSSLAVGSCIAKSANKPSEHLVKSSDSLDPTINTYSPLAQDKVS